jgi:hypothetical protein
MDDDDHSDNVVGVDSHPHLLFHRMDKKDDDADIVGCFHDVVVVVVGVVDDEELVDDEDDRVLLVVVLLHLHHSYRVEEAHYCNLMWRTEHQVEDDRQSAAVAVAAREEDEGLLLLLLLLFLIPPSPSPRIDDSNWPAIVAEIEVLAKQ